MTVAGRRLRRNRRRVSDGDFGLNYNNPAETPVSPYFQAVMLDAPAAYYRLNETGTNPFIDSANPGVASHNAVPNVTIVPGASLLAADTDPGITLDRNTGFTIAQTSFPFAQATMTIEFWIKVSSLTGPAYCCSSNDATHGWTVNYTNATGAWSVKPWPGAAYDFASGVAVGVAQHAVFVLTAANACTYYRNGAFVQTISGGAAMVATTIGLAIGNATSGPQAIIDELAIYPTALTYAQIRAHYDASLYGRYGSTDPRVVHRSWAGRS